MVYSEWNGSVIILFTGLPRNIFPSLHSSGFFFLSAKRKMPKGDGHENSLFFPLRPPPPHLPFLLCSFLHPIPLRAFHPLLLRLYFPFYVQPIHQSPLSEHVEQASTPSYSYSHVVVFLGYKVYLHSHFFVCFHAIM